MPVYSYPYMLIALLYFCLFCFEKNCNLSQRIILSIRFNCAIVYVLFFGFSGLIGSDWYNYYNYYELVSTYAYGDSGFEFGFELLTRVSNFVGLDFYAFKVLISLIQVYLLDKIISRYSSNVALAYIMLICFAPLLIVDAFRNFTSILIGFFSIPLLARGKKISAFIIILISASFHVTGLLFFCFFIMYKRYFNKQVIGLLFLVAILFYFMGISTSSIVLTVIDNLPVVSGTYYIKYVTYFIDTQPYGVSFGIIEKFLLLALLFMKYEYLTANRYVNPVIFNSACIYIFIFLLFSDLEFMVNRFSLMFILGYILTACVVLSVVKIKFNKFVFYSAFFLILLIKVWLSFNVIIYEYSNSLWERDDMHIRESNRFFYYEE